MQHAATELLYVFDVEKSEPYFLLLLQESVGYMSQKVEK